jgi:hypothetical protein
VPLSELKALLLHPATSGNARNMVWADQLGLGGGQDAGANSGGQDEVGVPPGHHRPVQGAVQLTGTRRVRGVTAGPHFAFRAGDEFSSDTVRDLALARLFMREGFDALRQAGAPRWALRAARLACQGKLATTPADDSTVAARMRELQSEFDSLAAASGDRWADLPWEAALTAGNAETVIRECAGDLLQDGGVLLSRVLRLVAQRFSDQGAIDPVIAAPVISFLIDHDREIREASYRLPEQADKMITGWLRAVSRAEIAAGAPAEIERWQPLRVRVRDFLLGSDPAGSDLEIEGLALLGTDTDNKVKAFLKGLAARRPGTLAPCVERYDATMSLAATHLDLLFELTEAYYIETPTTSAYRGPLDMGIRNHRFGPGIGVPFADWRFGPFWRLIPADPVRALGLINRMLDHGANTRVHPARGMASAAAVPGVQLDIRGVGRRYYIGDDHVWAWYRGTTVGPYPCMSALLAVEQFADQWLKQGFPAANVIAALLRDANNLAMPGLVVGLLTRHAEQVSDEADPFLASPAVWQLEAHRSAFESGIHAQGRDAPATGNDRRSWQMTNLAAWLIFTAARGDDQNRLDALRVAARELISAAADWAARDEGETDLPDSGTDVPAPSAHEQHEITVARRWASMLDASNYATRSDGENIVWEWQPPADIEAPLAKSRAELDRSAETYRLINAYCLRSAPPCMSEPPPLPAADTLTADSQSARGLLGEPATRPEPAQASAAVAAAVLRALVQDADAIPREEAEWAVITVAGALMTPLAGPGTFHGTLAPFGADRSAASAAPCLLMPAFTQGHGALLDDDDLSDLPQVLTAGTQSPFTEVKTILARNLEPVWAAPCGPGPQASPRCRHVIAWSAVEAGARDVALGPLKFPPGRRERRRLGNPIAASLGACPPGDLLLDQLAPSLVATLGAAQSNCCVADTARELREALLSAYLWAAVHWGDEGFDHRDEDQYAVAQALLRSASAEPRLFTKFVAGLTGQARALSEMLRSLAVAATYSPAARATLKVAWPALMTAILDAVDDGAQAFEDHSWGDQAVAELIPHPSPVTADRDPMATISAAADGWPTPQELTAQIKRWLPHAVSHWHTADNLIGLLQTTPPADQARLGLPWMHEIITSPRRAHGMGTFLGVEWLGSLRAAQVLGPDTWPLYGALVDALAAENYQGAVELQRRDE